MTRVKVCGLTRPADVDAAVAAGADALGVIVDVPVDTPREISPEKAASLLARLPPFTTGTLVTMGDEPDAVASLAQLVGADAIQVHGALSAGELSTLRAQADVPVLVAVDATDAERAHAVANVADAVLLDTPAQDGGGGTGRTHDWSLSADLASALSVPVILAGGLTPVNVADAIDAVDPFAVDVASGVEARGGVKDHDLVRDFVTTAQEAGP
jgi:phosphoribosylanthranilate isomerase